MTTGIQFYDRLGVLEICFTGSAVAERPNLAVKIAEVGASWAILEANAGYLLGVLMQAEPSSAIALLGKFSTPTSKVQAIQAIAKATLNEPHSRQLAALLRRLETAGRKRNDIAHGLWGIHSNRPLELAWGPPKMVAVLALTVPDLMASGTTVDDIVDEHRASIEFYDATRLDKVVAEIQELTEDFVTFAQPFLFEAVRRRHGGITERV